VTRQRQQLGAWGEEVAVRFLRQRGMKIVERNFRTPVGEIDIIARQRGILVFVEVKTRRSSRFGPPQEAVGRTKQRQILRAAQWYLAGQPDNRRQPRFDVVAICARADGAHIEHIPDAFGIDT
jgi:putative endonuclease